MNATKSDYILRDRLAHAGIAASLEDARILRLAELTLHRWHEQECGDSNDYQSWSNEVDDDGKAWRVVYQHTGKSSRYRIPNRESGARKRVAALCARLGLYFYVQTDPRGAALYISREPFAEFDYSRGVCCSVD
jgi:hypothetical protein